MVVTLTITSSTDHVTITLDNGLFMLSDTPANPQSQPTTVFYNQNTIGNFFNMKWTGHGVYLQQHDGDFDQITFSGLVNLPQNPPTLDYTIDRGGVGGVLLRVDTPNQGTSSPPINGSYSIPLTSSAVIAKEIELRLIPPPKDK
jgi:hypothetical protein